MIIWPLFRTAANWFVISTLICFRKYFFVIWDKYFTSEMPDQLLGYQSIYLWHMVSFTFLVKNIERQVLHWLLKLSKQLQQEILIIGISASSKWHLFHRKCNTVRFNELTKTAHYQNLLCYYDNFHIRNVKISSF